MTCRLSQPLVLQDTVITALSVRGTTAPPCLPRYRGHKQGYGGSQPIEQYLTLLRVLGPLIRTFSMNRRTLESVHPCGLRSYPTAITVQLQDTEDCSGDDWSWMMG